MGITKQHNLGLRTFLQKFCFFIFFNYFNFCFSQVTCTLSLNLPIKFIVNHVVSNPNKQPQTIILNMKWTRFLVQVILRVYS